jgi:hypothetical protein
MRFATFWAVSAGFVLVGYIGHKNEVLLGAKLTSFCLSVWLTPWQTPWHFGQMMVSIYLY